MKMRNLVRDVLSLIVPVALLLPSAQSQWVQQQQTSSQIQKPDQSQRAPEGQPPAQPRPAEDVPVTDGGAGPCSAEFTVTDSDAKPVFSALINVRMAYGFAGVRKLEMGVYTNAQGKGKFVGIPAKVRNPPLEFRAGKGILSGKATADPASECQVKREIVLQKSATSP
jgi:hypothetical protein